MILSQETTNLSEEDIEFEQNTREFQLLFLLVTSQCGLAVEFVRLDEALLGLVHDGGCGEDGGLEEVLGGRRVSRGEVDDGSRG